MADEEHRVGVHTDYKTLIIEMVKKVNDVEMLKKIYTFIKVWIE